MLAFLGFFFLTLLAVLGTIAGGLLMIGGVAFAVLAATHPHDSVAVAALIAPVPHRWATSIGFVAAVIGLAIYIAAGALFAANLP